MVATEDYLLFEPDLVSIIVPTKNRSSLLKRAIQSLVDQDYSKIEILIVDDNSIDDTYSVVDSFRDPRIHYISANSNGRSNARNLGIKSARGEFLAFLDDDDTYQSDKISLQFNLARAFPEKDVFVGKSLLKDMNDSQLNDSGIQELDHNQIYRNFHPGIIMLPSLFFRFSRIREMHFDPSLNRFEDLDFYSRNIINSTAFFHSDIVANVYTHPGNSLSAPLAKKIPQEITSYVRKLRLRGNYDGDGLSKLYSYYGSALIGTNGFYWHGVLLLLKGLWYGPNKKSLRNLKFVLNVGKTGLKRFLLWCNPTNLHFLGRFKFKLIYKFKLFGKSESASGPGSDPKQTRILVRSLPKLFAKLEISSLADVPCGDFNWMREIDLGDIEYTGFDIVGELIKKNKIRYPSHKFRQIDITKKSFNAHDLVICRDLTVHLSNKQIFNLLENFKKSGSKYLLTTTFPHVMENRDLGKEIWRPLNLEKAPFNFGPPLDFLLEESSESPLYPDKGLALWELDLLNIESND